MSGLKVILMYPNFRWLKDWENKTIWKIHPYNLCLLSAMIDKKYDVRVIDANMENLTKEKFSDLLKSERQMFLEFLF